MGVKSKCDSYCSYCSSFPPCCLGPVFTCYVSRCSVSLSVQQQQLAVQIHLYKAQFCPFHDVLHPGFTRTPPLSFCTGYSYGEQLLMLVFPHENDQTYAFSSLVSLRSLICCYHLVNKGLIILRLHNEPTFQYGLTRWEFSYTQQNRFKIWFKELEH